MSVCVSVGLSLAAFPYCADPDVTWRNGTGCPLVVHYWADLQSVNGFRCCDNTAPNAKCQRVLALALCHGLNFRSTTADSGSTFFIRSLTNSAFVRVRHTVYSEFFSRKMLPQSCSNCTVSNIRPFSNYTTGFLRRFGGRRLRKCFKIKRNTFKLCGVSVTRFFVHKSCINRPIDNSMVE